MGQLDRSGYGKFKAGKQTTGAHRASWLARKGPIPEGLVIDHLCRNRACINVDHMEPVTNAVNARRSTLVGRGSGQHAGLTGRLKTACVNGHAFDEENTAWRTRPDGYLVRVCRACNRERLRRFKARRRQEAAPDQPEG
jgi:hypothetical protein